MYLHKFNYSHKFKNYKHLNCMGEMRKEGGALTFYIIINRIQRKSW